jgi:hypothetical protein
LAVFCLRPLLIAWLIWGTSARKLRRPEILRMALVFAIIGFAALISSFFAEDLRGKVVLLSLGLSGIGGGILNVSKTKNGPNQALQHNAGDAPSADEALPPRG